MSDVKKLATKLELNPEQTKYLESLTVEEITDLEAMPESSAVFLINEAMSTETVDIEGLEAETVENEKIPTFKAGGLGLKAGTKKVLTFLGLQNMFSKEEKENWEEIKLGDTILYRSQRFIFKTEKGDKVAIFNYPTLGAVLKKLKTNESNPLVPMNPKVIITYHGKVAKKDTEKVLGYKLKKGNAVHHFGVAFADKESLSLYDKYNDKILCYLNNPMPEMKAKSELSKEEREELSWDMLQQAQNEYQQHQIQGNTPAQIVQ